MRLENPQEYLALTPYQRKTNGFQGFFDGS